MTDVSKIRPSHTQRAAFVYIRQSTPGQVEHNRESTARQYALADKACQLGWSKEQVVIVDEDLGLSGSGTDKRSGFARLTSEAMMQNLPFMKQRNTPRRLLADARRSLLGDNRNHDLSRRADVICR